MELFDALTARHSTRAYTAEPVNDEQISLLIEAANAAPIGMNAKENVHLTVVKDQSLLKEFRRTLSNDLTYGAPLLLIVSTRDDGRTGIEMEAANASCILENVLLAATGLGLGSVYLWGVSRVLLPQNPTLAAKLNIPEGFAPFAAAALGHAASPATSAPHKPIACDII